MTQAKQSIYDLHDKAFQHVSAYVVMRDGERFSTIAFKFPKDGAGRLYCYVHIIGAEMARGYAGGYGYDKRSAAVCDAVKNIKPYELADNMKDIQWAELHSQALNEQISDFKGLFKDIGGMDWDQVLRDAGFTTYNAI